MVIVDVVVQDADVGVCHCCQTQDVRFTSERWTGPVCAPCAFSALGYCEHGVMRDDGVVCSYCMEEDA